MSSRKRKFRGRKAQNDSPHDRHEGLREPDPSLYIQAFEADMIHGTQAKAAVASLEVTDSGAGNGLILWGAAKQESSQGSSTGKMYIFDSADDDNVGPSAAPDIWVDRYDVRLLLETLPQEYSSSVSCRDASPSGWSDLPSDAEDTFFLDPDEVEAYKRDKRRRVLDRDREARLKAIQDSEGPDAVNEEVWGGSDEEPEEEQNQLMSRTAKHLVTSPNPAQLEMRILANHGSDKRFSFLRGRWKLAWKIALSKARLEVKTQNEAKTIAKPATQNSTSLGGLTSYGDSESDSEEGVPENVFADESSAIPTEVEGDVNGGSTCDGNDRGLEALKEARRARAKEWAQNRRESKAGAS